MPEFVRQHADVQGGGALEVALPAPQTTVFVPGNSRGNGYGGDVVCAMTIEQYRRTYGDRDGDG